jgi:hypothetical protein
MKLAQIATAALLLVGAAGDAAAQQKTLKDRLLGTWHFVIAEVTAPHGQKSFPFGPKPRGILMFTPEGDFAQIHIAGEVPKIASGNRLAATPEEYSGIMRGTIAQFGTYTVDEDKQTFTMKFTQHLPMSGQNSERKGCFQGHIGAALISKGFDAETISGLKAILSGLSLGPRIFPMQIG